MLFMLICSCEAFHTIVQDVVYANEKGYYRRLGLVNQPGFIFFLLLDPNFSTKFLPLVCVRLL